LLSPIPPKVGGRGDLYTLASLGRYSREMMEVPPESMMPGLRGLSLLGAAPIQARIGQGRALRYDTPVPTLKAVGTSWIGYNSDLGNLTSFGSGRMNPFVYTEWYSGTILTFRGGGASSEDSDVVDDDKSSPDSGDFSSEESSFGPSFSA